MKRAANSSKPDLACEERLAEIAEIRPAGPMRLRGEQSSPESAAHKESSLDCAAHQSGDLLACVGAVRRPSNRNER